MWKQVIVGVYGLGVGCAIGIIDQQMHPRCTAEFSRGEINDVDIKIVPWEGGVIALASGVRVWNANVWAEDARVIPTASAAPAIPDAK
jgi:hypothetical protein